MGVTTGSGRSNDRPVGYTLRWYETQQPSHAASVLGRHAYSIGKAVGRLMTDPPGWEHVTRHLPQADAGSSWTARGGRVFRTWWLTASFGSAYLDATLVLPESGWWTGLSANGPGGTKTSDSSKSSTGEASTIGTAVPIHVEED